MNVVKVAVGAAVIALVAGHQLSAMTPARRAALWQDAELLAGGKTAAIVPARTAAVMEPPGPVPVPFASGGFDEALSPDGYGQFHTAIEIDGQRLPAMVDTGASHVVLTAEDAERIGIRPLPSDFRYPTSTANGRAMVAKVRLPSVRLGGIVLRDVEALVSGRGALGQSLLGMSFLSRLSAVRMDHGRMLLAQ